MPCVCQDLGLADAGELQELRRRHGARAQDDLASGARFDLAAPALVDDADAALALEQDAARRRLGDDVQIAPPPGRPQIAMRHAHAPASGDAGLRLDDAFLVLAVVVRIELVAGGDRGLEQRIVERVLVRHLRDAQRAAGAAPVGAAVLVALDAREQRRHVLPAPAARAHLRPGVVVERLAAHPDEAVDGARAAQHLAARHRDLAIGGAGLGLGFVAPVGGGIVDQQAEADGKARIGMAARAPPRSAAPACADSRSSRAASTAPAEPAPTTM